MSGRWWRLTRAESSRQGRLSSRGRSSETSEENEDDEQRHAPEDPQGHTQAPHPTQPVVGARPAALLILQLSEFGLWAWHGVNPPSLHSCPSKPRASRAARPGSRKTAGFEIVDRRRCSSGRSRQRPWRGSSSEPGALPSPEALAAPPASGGIAALSRRTSGDDASHNAGSQPRAGEVHAHDHGHQDQEYGRCGRVIDHPEVRLDIKPDPPRPHEANRGGDPRDRVKFAGWQPALRKREAGPAPKTATATATAATTHRESRLTGHGSRVAGHGSRFAGRLVHFAATQ